MADPEAEDAKPEKRENDPFYLRPVFIVCTIFVIILIIISVVLVREFAGRRRRRGRH